ncbi:MAG: DUF4347 domain-containing protein, partial [Methylobacter sp.]
MKNRLKENSNDIPSNLSVSVMSNDALGNADLSLAGILPSVIEVQRTEVVFIESNVADYQTLLNGVSPGAEVHVLDALMDGLAQMAQILAGRSGIDAIHILSHGTEGSVQLGTLNLTLQNLQAHTDDLAAIGSALTPDADILLYGCSVAAGSDGAVFIEALAQVTHADIAASNNATGAATLGGDWILESSIGDVQTENMWSVSAGNGWQALLDVAAAITSATYNATTGVLDVTTVGMTTGDIIDGTKLVLTGEGPTDYTLTTTGITATSATEFLVTLNGADQAALGLIMNKASTSSTGGTTFNLAGNTNWDV